MRGFPLRAEPTLLCRVEIPDRAGLPNASVSAERAGDHTYLLIRGLEVGITVALNSRAEADALAAAVRAGALLLEPGGDKAAVVAALRAAADEIEEGS